MKEFLLNDSSFEDDTFDENYPINYQLSEAENAQIQVQVNRLEIKHFCDDMSDGIMEYINERKNLSRRRQQDVSALRYIIAQNHNYKTKEECMMLMRERLDRVKTGWFIFRGNSRLRTTVYKVMSLHSSTVANKFRQELILEKQAHKLLLKRCDAMRLTCLEDMSHELIQLRTQNEALKKQLNPSNTPEKSSTVQALASRFKGMFGN